MVSTRLLCVTSLPSRALLVTGIPATDSGLYSRLLWPEYW